MEKWKKIEGHDLQVSSHGKIRSFDMFVEHSNKKTVFFKKGRMRKIYIANNGYWYITLNNISTPVHRLMAKAFIPNPENKLTVNHKDGVKLNNDISNLEWSTYKENNDHALKLGLRPITNNGNTGYNSPLSHTVFQYTLEGEFIKEYGSISDAARKNNLSQGHISSVCRGIRNKHGGFVWRLK